MTVINRRNAALGWGTWEVGKWYVRRKAKKRSPLDSLWARVGAIGVAAVGTLGALAFWKKRASGAASGQSS